LKATQTSRNSKNFKNFLNLCYNEIQIWIKKYRIDNVPSSNVTMETEICSDFRSRESMTRTFYLHSSRMRLKKVTKKKNQPWTRWVSKCALRTFRRSRGCDGLCLFSRHYEYGSIPLRSEVNFTSRNQPTTLLHRDFCWSFNQRIERGAKQIYIITPYMRPLTIWWWITSNTKALK
jgi:hypothetical protein